MARMDTNAGPISQIAIVDAISTNQQIRHVMITRILVLYSHKLEYLARFHPDMQHATPWDMQHFQIRYFRGLALRDSIPKFTPKLLKSETSNLLISYSFEKIKEFIKRRVKVLIKLQELEHRSYINQFVTKIVRVNAPQWGEGSPSRAASRKYRS